MTCRHIPAEIIKKRGVSVKKRILSILLAALMLLSALPLGMVDTAWAAETEVVASGSCGLNVKWVLTSDGTLTISGKTRIDDYGIGGAPWYNLRQYIKKVAIQNGVQAIGDCDNDQRKCF